MTKLRSHPLVTTTLIMLTQQDRGTACPTLGARRLLRAQPLPQRPRLSHSFGKHPLALPSQGKGHLQTHMVPAPFWKGNLGPKLARVLLKDHPTGSMGSHPKGTAKIPEHRG